MKKIRAVGLWIGICCMFSGFVPQTHWWSAGYIDSWIDAIDQGANNAQADEYCPGVLEAAAGGMAAAAGVRWNQYLAGGTNGQTRIFGSGRIEIHVNPNHTIDLGVILIHEGLHAAQNGMSHSEIYSAAETCRQYLPPPPPP